MMGAVLLVIVAMAVFPVSASARAGGLSVSSNTVFEVVPQESLVRVAATYSATNVTRNKVSGNYITQYYYGGISLPVPAEAVGLSVVRSDGRELSFETVPDEATEELNRIEVSFGRNLFYRSSATFTVHYDLVDSGPRSEGMTRANPAYASFSAYGIGDDGQVEVSFIVPIEFEVETVGSDTESRVEDHKRIYSATEIEDPFDFFVFVVARNDDALVSTKVESSGVEVELNGWPGDPAWSDFATDSIETDLPILVDLVGLDYPVEKLEITESMTPSLYGFAGWHDTNTDEIEVVEDLDSTLMLHELSHAWFNEVLFEERFVSEGLAEEFASRAVEASGETLPVPERTFTSGLEERALINWGYSRTGNGGVEEHGYNASATLMRLLTDEIGIDGLSLVVQAADADLAAYRGDGEPETVSEDDDWRRFLDLLEEVGGSTKAVEHFNDWVLTDDQADEMAERADARNAYQELQDRGGDWAPPLVVRQDMGEWDFTAAEVAIENARSVLETRDSITQALENRNIGLPSDLELLYENSDETGLVTLLSTAQHYEQSANELVSAREAIDADRNPVEKVGGWFSDVEVTYNSAVASFENNEAQAASNGAAIAKIEVGDYLKQGLLRISGAFAALLVLLFGTLTARGWTEARLGVSSPHPGYTDSGPGLVPDDESEVSGAETEPALS